MCVCVYQQEPGTQHARNVGHRVCSSLHFSFFLLFRLLLLLSCLRHPLQSVFFLFSFFFSTRNSVISDRFFFKSFFFKQERSIKSAVQSLKGLHFVFLYSNDIAPLRALGKVGQVRLTLRNKRQVLTIKYR